MSKHLLIPGEADRNVISFGHKTKYQIMFLALGEK